MSGTSIWGRNGRTGGEEGEGVAIAVGPSLANPTKLAWFLGSADLRIKTTDLIKIALILGADQNRADQSSDLIKISRILGAETGGS